MREHCGRILRCHVQIVDELIQIALLVCLVDLVGAVPIWEERQIISSFEDLIVEVKVASRIEIRDVKGFCAVRHVRVEFGTSHVRPIPSHIERILAHHHALLVRVPARAQLPRWRLSQLRRSRSDPEAEKNESDRNDYLA